MKKIDEKELHDLFNGFKERNQSAYNQLYEKYYKLVYGIAFSVMKNKEDSEDIANEVFTKIYRLDKEKLPVSNEASWLFTVTRNECFSYLRKSRQNISIDEIYEVPSKSQEIEEIIDSEYYNKLISGLSEQEKTIISLKILSNFTFSKISQVMNIPIGTVQWKYYKAINSLKVSIGGLVGAAIAFMLVVLRRDKISKEAPYANKENINNVNSQSAKSTENTDVSKASETIDSVETKEDAKTNENESTSSSQMAAVDNTVGNTVENIVDNTAENATEKISTPDIANFNGNAEKNNEANTIAQTTNETASNMQKIDSYTVAGIVVGITFLIIFVIFFIKYQQKFHKKTSK